MTKNKNPHKNEFKNINNKALKFVVGIDEVGRGPVAGPVTVCAVLMTEDAYKDFKENEICQKLRDSKKLSEKRREEWLDRIVLWQKDGMLDYAVFNLSAEAIDKFGITSAIQKCLNKCLEKLEVPVEHDCAQILLDGSLIAPDKYKNQKTIVGGDASEPIIALASIVAKVNRDKYMIEKSIEFPEYGMDRHKGYGTSAHMKAIEKYGLSNFHRRSFLKRFL
ncbi:ribonuclease HII [Candidatus Parcubacteria bacterium]|nr:ribonuclease HII [Candidatus Parcubacteria bacterium]